MAFWGRLVRGQIVLQISRSRLLTSVVSVICEVNVKRHMLKNDWAALDIHCKVHAPRRKQINKNKAAIGTTLPSEGGREEGHLLFLTSHHMSEMFHMLFPLIAIKNLLGLFYLVLPMRRKDNSRA